MSKPNRRDFIRAAGLAFGSVLLFPACLKQRDAFRFFTSQEAKCIMAVCEQIIPKDEFPGATDAGVIHYIDRQLSGVFHYDQQTYREGIQSLQAYSTANYHDAFESLSADDQIRILKAMESNQMSETEWKDGRPSVFFNLVLAHTMQGFYGSPIHGGNKDYLSFEMLRIDYPLVIGQNRYRS
ncbi:MAG: gluconate 2-dehydrogenase subunit 3 family protein [Verrucomicrobia bacterium]|nr:gluconate 2-dehydrogenase subunit 3 family protein [Prolixibacteraceae bacterium]